MKHSRLEAMTKGWFVGDFVPNALQATSCEVAIKHYKAGDHEWAHVHRVATEVTAIVTGRVRMLGAFWGAGDILVIEPGEATDFEALADTITVVVKLPSVRGDKYAMTDSPAVAPVPLARR
jgi:hypothetical protein